MSYSSYSILWTLLPFLRFETVSYSWDLSFCLLAFCLVKPPDWYSGRRHSACRGCSLTLYVKRQSWSEVRQLRSPTARIWAWSFPYFPNGSSMVASFPLQAFLSLWVLVLGQTWEQGNLGSDDKSTTCRSFRTLGQIFNLFVPWFPHLTNGDYSSTYRLGLWWALNGLLFGKHWEWCLKQRLLAIVIIVITIISDRGRKEGWGPTGRLECWGLQWRASGVGELGAGHLSEKSSV